MNGDHSHKEDVLSHYETPRRFDDRLQLYRFGTGSIDWYQWVFERLKLKRGDRILEIGCGNARLWQSRLEKLPRDTLLVLADFSVGMLSEAKRLLGTTPGISYQLLDAETIPSVDQTYDVLIANHMLYHVPMIGRALTEMKRSLRDGGLLYTSAPSRMHLQELKSLLLSFDKSLVFPKDDVTRFCMENGKKQLERFFTTVTLHVYTNEITVTSSDPVVRYVLSLFDGTQYPDLRGHRDSFEALVRSKLEQTGSLTLTGVTGLFECSSR
jgi:ubiquinone/menaquinone biosynthesis C-methylase UbiE